MVGVCICIPSHPRGHKVPSHFNFLYEGIFCFFLKPHQKYGGINKSYAYGAWLEWLIDLLAKQVKTGSSFFLKQRVPPCFVFSLTVSLSKGTHGGILLQNPSLRRLRRDGKAAQELCHLHNGQDRSSSCSSAVPWMTMTHMPLWLINDLSSWDGNGTAALPDFFFPWKEKHDFKYPHLLIYV